MIPYSLAAVPYESHLVITWAPAHFGAGPFYTLAFHLDKPFTGTSSLLDHNVIEAAPTNVCKQRFRSPKFPLIGRKVERTPLTPKKTC